MQNIVAGRSPTTRHAVDALVEELFPSAGMTDMHAFYGSGGDDAELNDRLTQLMASVARIGADRDLDLVPGSRYVYDARATARGIAATIASTGSSRSTSHRARQAPAARASRAARSAATLA